MEHERVGVAPPAGADRPRHRRADATAHPAGGHGLHQHDEREREGHAGERVGAEPAQEVGFAGAHRGLDGHDDDVGRGQTEQGRHDWPFEEQAGSIGDWALTGRGGGRRGRKGADVPGSHREAVPLAIGRRSRGTPSGIHWSPLSVQMPAEATGILGLPLSHVLASGSALDTA